MIRTKDELDDIFYADDPLVDHDVSSALDAAVRRVYEAGRLDALADQSAPSVESLPDPGPSNRVPRHGPIPIEDDDDDDLWIGLVAAAAVAIVAGIGWVIK